LGANVDEFVPSKWINKGEPNSFVFPTFNAGPRMRPGKSLALMKLKLSLAFLVTRFDVDDPFGHCGITVVRMKDGFRFTGKG
jgi:cytochrome P450